jgi:hypothetical protein
MKRWRFMPTENDPGVARPCGDMPGEHDPSSWDCRGSSLESMRFISLGHSGSCLESMTWQGD